jgi:uncharacterized Ntn-hydrolase superfamily protein
MTYSIVARDAETGALGVAVQTALPGVGRLCPWAEAGIGAVATQALVRVSHGNSGLTLMRNGHTAPQALAAVLAGDPDANVRQVGMVDAHGNAAAHTGSNAIRYAGHHVGDGYSVQANMMAKDTVPAAMSSAFESAHGTLVLRIITALKAAQTEGGDFRGQQSAALKIVSGKLPSADWQGILFDVRVDDHPEPVMELERICKRHLAYQISDEASDFAAKGDYDAALKHFQEAVALDSSDYQFRFWFALGMADEYGQLNAVTSIFRDVFAHDPMWIECLTRYAETRSLKTDGIVEQILALTR